MLQLSLKINHEAFKRENSDGKIIVSMSKIHDENDFHNQGTYCYGIIHQSITVFFAVKPSLIFQWKYPWSNEVYRLKLN